LLRRKNYSSEKRKKQAGLVIFSFSGESLINSAKGSLKLGVGLDGSEAFEGKGMFKLDPGAAAAVGRNVLQNLRRGEFKNAHD
jgi:hypothetical protein